MVANILGQIRLEILVNGTEMYAGKHASRMARSCYYAFFLRHMTEKLRRNLYYHIYISVKKQSEQPRSLDRWLLPPCRLPQTGREEDCLYAWFLY